MLSLPRLFADDHRDGTLEQLALAPQPLGLIVLGKVIAHWLVAGLPLVCWHRCWVFSSTWPATRWQC
jgi:heme exporter protein CcmB